MILGDTSCPAATSSKLFVVRSNSKFGTLGARMIPAPNSEEHPADAVIALALALVDLPSLTSKKGKLLLLVHLRPL